MDTAEFAEIYRLQVDLLINQLNSFRAIHNIYVTQEFTVSKGIYNQAKALEKRLLHAI